MVNSKQKTNRPWREVTTPTEVGHCAWGFAVGRSELPEWCEVYDITDITMGEWEMIYAAWDYMEESAIEYFNQPRNTKIRNLYFL